MLRPEQLVATTVSDGRGGTRVGTVLASEFRGHDVVLEVDLGADGVPITVRQHSIDPPAVTATVRVDVIGAGVVLDDGAS